MLSNELEHCLNDAFLRSRKTGHAHSTIEHLLLNRHNITRQDLVNYLAHDLTGP